MNKTLHAVGLGVLLAVTIKVAPAAGSEKIKAFGPGERMEFVLKWAGFAVADATLTVEESFGSNGETIYRIISTARSRSVIDSLYKVRNRYESHINPEDGLPVKYIAQSREREKKKDRVYLFDQENNIVRRMEKREGGETTSEIFEIPEFTYDTISSLYAMRDREARIGESLLLNVFNNRKNYELVIDILKEEEITVSAGRFSTIKVQPKLKSEGAARKKGELFIWVTNDERHIPVLMKSKVKVGSFTLELKRYADGNGTVYGEQAND